MPAAAIALDLGHDLPAPEPPQGLFGAPRYTAEQQAANPTKPLTRVVKDVLHVGTIRVVDEANGDRQLNWRITPPLLAALADAHAVARSRGYATVMGHTHGDRATRLIHPRDQIAPVEQLLSDGRVLWASVYVRPDVAADLENPAMKVSPYILAGWEDTGGHVYPAKVMHVAVTDNPRVPGQGPFRVAFCDPVTKRETPMNLRNLFRLPRRSKPLFAVALAEGDEVAVEDADASGESPAGGEVTGDGVDTLIDQVATLLDAAYGLVLPEGTDGTNIVDRLTLILDMAQQLSGGEAEEETAVVEEGVVSQAVPMANPVRKPARKAAPTSPRDALRKAFKAGQRKAHFEAALEAAAKAGTAANVIEAKRQLGKRFGYDPSLLSDMPTAVPMGNPLGRLVDGSAPQVNRVAAKKRTAEEIKAEAQRIIRGQRR